MFKKRTFGPTKYNLDIDAQINTQYIDQKIYDASVHAFREAGFSGERHVDSAGRLVDGFDPHCPTILEGKYDIFDRGRIQQSIGDFFTTRQMLTAGVTERGAEALAMGESLAKMLEKTGSIKITSLESIHSTATFPNTGN
jgi:hypothetical protein